MQRTKLIHNLDLDLKRTKVLHNSLPCSPPCVVHLLQLTNLATEKLPLAPAGPHPAAWHMQSQLLHQCTPG